MKKNGLDKFFKILKEKGYLSPVLGEVLVLERLLLEIELLCTSVQPFFPGWDAEVYEWFTLEKRKDKLIETITTIATLITDNFLDEDDV